MSNPLDNLGKEEPKKVLVTLTPTQATHLAELAESEHRTLSNLVGFILMKELKKYEQK